VRSALLVARREYRQIANTRGFWVILLLVPLIIAGSQIAGRFLRPPSSDAYVIVDGTGTLSAQIEHRLKLQDQRRTLSDLAAFTQRWSDGSALPDQPWARGQRYFSDGDVETFIDAGGKDAAIADLKGHLKPDAPKFDAQLPFYVRAELPAITADQSPEALDAALKPLMEKDIVTPAGKLPLTLVVVIPREFGLIGPPVRMWTNGRPNQSLIETVRGELTRALKEKAIAQSGLPADVFARINAVNAPVALTVPPAGAGRSGVLVRSTLPLALVYLLLITVMVTGGLMLQGVIEERSNKLLESLLSAMHARDLMYGKLLGLGAIGFTIILVWVGFALTAALSVQGVVADFIRPSLAALDQPWIVAAMIFYFVAGYLIISMLYLAIGSLSNSLQDAQAYLMPVIFIIMLPTMFMMFSIVQNPDALLPRVMSWIPLYTPFAMLGRMGSGVSLLEVLGTGAMLAAFLVVELFLIGRLFQASLLQTGQPPALMGLIKRMSGKAKAA
jgi:ABC-2 type transport system permease protein